MARGFWSMPDRQWRWAGALWLGLASKAFTPGLLASGLWATGIAWLSLEIALSAREGYYLRKPHWTADSWRQWRRTLFVRAALFAAMFVVVGVPVLIGKRETPARWAWAVVMVGGFLVTGLRFIATLTFLTGRPSEQFRARRRARA